MPCQKAISHQRNMDRVNPSTSREISTPPSLRHSVKRPPSRMKSAQKNVGIIEGTLGESKESSEGVSELKPKSNDGVRSSSSLESKEMSGGASGLKSKANEGAASSSTLKSTNGGVGLRDQVEEFGDQDGKKILRGISTDSPKSGKGFAKNLEPDGVLSPNMIEMGKRSSVLSGIEQPPPSRISQIHTEMEDAAFTKGASRSDNPTSEASQARLQTAAERTAPPASRSRTEKTPAESGPPEDKRTPIDRRESVADRTPSVSSKLPKMSPSTKKIAPITTEVERINARAVELLSSRRSSKTELDIGKMVIQRQQDEEPAKPDELILKPEIIPGNVKPTSQVSPQASGGKTQPSASKTSSTITKPRKRAASEQPTAKSSSETDDSSQLSDAPGSKNLKARSRSVTIKSPSTSDTDSNIEQIRLDPSAKKPTMAKSALKAGSKAAPKKLESTEQKTLKAGAKKPQRSSKPPPTRGSVLSAVPASETESSTEASGDSEWGVERRRRGVISRDCFRSRLSQCQTNKYL
ncbi:hypothetical protein BC829DRAFT_41034 [Chytridium lagenaria]|nr:hypothetical protein BC829DRAFT_41034 [Chytridium lagenaria]